MTEQEIEYQLGLQDAKTSNDFMRVACYSTILINGGAVTATVALLNTSAAKGLSHPVLSWVLSLYAAGVFFGAISLALGSLAIEQWFISHRYYKEEKSREKIAEKYWLATKCLVGMGMISFFVSCLTFAWNIS